ncbi:MAG: HDOD domain-containing protein [Pirellulales bacterium]|nr:HDOD domain-containing protein [Pirellulales bacterium]
MTTHPFSEVDLKKILNVGQLPAMPQSAVSLLNLSRDSNSGPAEYAIAIEADPGLTVQILRFVNSSYFGFRNEISNVRQAITLVGVRTIKNFALYSAVFSMIPNPKCGPFDLRKLWQDSLRRGLFARRMGKVLGMREAEEPFAAALLQDMAVPLLAKEVPDAYATLFGARSDAQSKIRLSRLEEHVFGWTHAEAAGIVARQWDLPEAFAVLIEDHLNVECWAAHADSEPGKLAVSLSALLPTTGDPAWPEFSLFERHYQKVVPSGGPTIDEILADVDREFADFAPVLKIALTSQTLSDRLHEITGQPAAAPAASV